MTFQNKAVIVTGGTSGIGRALVNAFAKDGAKVMFSGRDKARGAEVEREAGKSVAFLQTEARESAAADRLIQACVDRFGRLDVLVNNAGMLHRTSTLEATDEQWLDSMAVNVDSLFFLSRAAARIMKPQGGGVIVNIASEMGKFGNPRSIPYAVSKAAVIQMTRAMALDFAQDKIRVVCVAPGGTRTPMLEKSVTAQGFPVEEGLVRYSTRVPMRRFARMAEVTPAVLFVASDNATYITGSTVFVDGGTTSAGPGGKIDEARPS